MTLCDKLGYPTRKAAMDAISQISRRDKQSMKVYYCQGCSLFHAATEGKKKSIPVIKHSQVQYNPENPFGTKRKIQPTAPQAATAKLISSDMAKHLKRLIEGRNQLDKQINK